VVGAVAEEEIDESGAGHLDFRDRLVGRQRLDQGEREPARILARRLREPHRQIAREVAEGRVARALDLDRDIAASAGHEILGERRQRPLQQIFDQFLHTRTHHHPQS